MIYTQVVPASHLTPACHPPCPPRSWPFPRTTQWPWGEGDVARIYVSSTYGDLKEHREEVYRTPSQARPRRGRDGGLRRRRPAAAGAVPGGCGGLRLVRRHLRPPLR